MWRSMVCGALWWSPDQTRPLRGQIAKFIFLWHWGTAVSLASGSRLVIPALDRTRPRSPQPHCTHTHFTKNGQRASPCEYLVIIGSPLWVLTTVHHLAYSCWFSSALMSTDRGRREWERLSPVPTPPRAPLTLIYKLPLQSAACMVCPRVTSAERFLSAPLSPA